MSTSKHLDKICLAAIAVGVAVALLLVLLKPASTASAGVSMKYEGTIFDNSYVHQIAIEMDDWDSFITNCEDEEYTACNLTVDGTHYENIAIRAKGNTSLSNVSSMGSQRYSFKIEFDHFQNGVNLDGLDKICLNNLIQDNTMMKDYLVYTMMNEFGVDSPLCSYSYLTVNGADWGLYLAVESIEDSFLARNYGEDIGDLYKPDSMSFGGGRGNGKGFDMDEFNEKNAESTDDSETSAAESSAESSSDETSAANAMPGQGDGMQRGGGMQQGGGMQMPEGGDFDTSNIPSDFDASNIPSDFDASNIPNNIDSGNMRGGQGGGMQQGGQGGGMQQGGQGGGMGSDDVKLKYIDDNVSSYSNIFDSAKTSVTSEDQNRLINSLKNLTNYENLEETVEINEVMRYFVVHNFVCNGDSYTGSMIHNYYLYEKDGQMSMIPWDYNLAFGTFQGNDASSSVNTSIDSPVSGGSVDDRPMVGWIFSDATYTDAYHALFVEFIKEWFADGKLSKLIDQTAEMIAPYVESDPTKFCTYDEFEVGVETIKEYVTLRAEAVTNQLAGNTTEVDTGDLDLSLMGTMNTGKGGEGGQGGEMQQGGGQMPEGGDAPEKSDGEHSTDVPQMPSGEQGGDTPQMPSGEQGGDVPEMPSGNQGGGMPQGGGQMPGGGGV